MYDIIKCNVFGINCSWNILDIGIYKKLLLVSNLNIYLY